MQNKQSIDHFLDGVVQITDRISRPDIDRFIEVLFDVWRNQRTVFIMGNGGSASTATHFTADLNKMTVFPGMPRMRVHSLVDNVPYVSALTNDDGWENIYVEQLKNFFRPGDVVIGISVHGGSGQDQAGVWSQNLLKALQYAKDNRGVALGLSGFDGGPMKQIADPCIVVPFDTTPHVESFHVTLHHLITFCLAEKIRREGNGANA